MLNKPIFHKNYFYLLFCSYSKATHHKCTWAYRVFQDWFAEWKGKLDCDAVVAIVDEDLLTMSDEHMVYVLTRFILEVKKKNGDDYPAKTLYELIICLQLFMFMQGRKVKLLG